MVRYGARRRINDSCFASGSAVSGWICSSQISGVDGSGSVGTSVNFSDGNSAGALSVRPLAVSAEVVARCQVHGRRRGTRCERRFATEGNGRASAEASGSTKVPGRYFDAAATAAITWQSGGALRFLQHKSGSPGSSPVRAAWAARAAR